jgi:hypothetical protein
MDKIYTRVPPPQPYRVSRQSSTEVLRSIFLTLTADWRGKFAPQLGKARDNGFRNTSAPVGRSTATLSDVSFWRRRIVRELLTVVLFCHLARAVHVDGNRKKRRSLISTKRRRPT